MSVCGIVWVNVVMGSWGWGVRKNALASGGGSPSSTIASRSGLCDVGEGGGRIGIFSKCRGGDQVPWVSRPKAPKGRRQTGLRSGIGPSLVWVVTWPASGEIEEDLLVIGG